MPWAIARILKLGTLTWSNYNALVNESFDIRSLKDKYVLVCFWATFSPPALLEMRKLENVYPTYRDKGFEIVSICMDEDKEKAKSVIDKLNWPWIQLWDRQLPDENPLSLEMGISAVPSMIFLDKENNVTSLEVNSFMQKQGLEVLFNPRPESTPEATTSKPAKKADDPAIKG